MTRRSFVAGLAKTTACSSAALTTTASAAGAVNAPRTYKVRVSDRALDCVVDTSDDLGPIDRRIFGTNLEWFNEGGGLAAGDRDLRERLQTLAREQALSVMRFPGGILADYYNWRDGVGPATQRPVRKHPTDPGRSANVFGSPEFFALLKSTGAEGLITVNAGTSTPQVAADWVRYANSPADKQRQDDGFAEPIGIKLWEVGNELYLPGDPGEIKITQTPEQYTTRFAEFADALRAADPTITVIAIGVSKAGVGPGSQFPEWTEVLLRGAAAKIDMISVHNAYFPLLYYVNQPPVDVVYRAMWASPEAVARSLRDLDGLISRFEAGRQIRIALTEWGPLFTLPQADPYWFDHVKTLGSGIYIARLLQVLMSQPRVALTNYFKFADRSFMGWVNFKGEPKVPYWVFKLFTTATGARRVAVSLDSPVYDTPGIGAVGPERDVAEVTAFASQSADRRSLFINLVNRGLETEYPIRIRLRSDFAANRGEIRYVTAREPTAHNGVDIPPEWPMRPEYEPFTTAAPGSIRIASRAWSKDEPIALPPFSVATAILTSDSVR